VDACAELENCSDACVNLDESPLHCGECDNPCDADELCIGGDCREYAPTDECSSCSGGMGTCCGYPGDEVLQICVEGGDCP